MLTYSLFPKLKGPKQVSTPQDIWNSGLFYISEGRSTHLSMPLFSRSQNAEVGPGRSVFGLCLFWDSFKLNQR